MKKPIEKKKAPTKSAISKKTKEELLAHEGTKSRSKSFPIVAIGGSAGGLESITELLQHLSPNTGMAFVYVQHLDPTYKSMLSPILTRQTAMIVQEAEEKMKIEKNHLYIMPPNKEMHIIDGVLVLDPRPKRPEMQMPINRFFCLWPINRKKAP